MASAIRSRLRAGVLTVPGVFVGYLRAGLHLQFGNAAKEVATLSFQPWSRERSEAYTTARSTQNASCALLYLIGWDPKRPEPDMRVNLYRHRAPLLGAFKLISDLAEDALTVPRSPFVDAEEIYGLRFYSWGVEEWITRMPSVSAVSGVALRIGADLEVAALSLRSNGGRLWSNLTARMRRAGRRSESVAARNL
jgi:hypothetical protein